MSIRNQDFRVVRYSYVACLSNRKDYKNLKAILKAKTFYQ